MAVLVSTYVVGEPTFYATAVIIIGSAAFFIKIITSFGAIDVEITDVRAYFFKLSNEFFVFGHGCFPPWFQYTKKPFERQQKLRSIFEMIIFSFCGRIMTPKR